MLLTLFVGGAVLVAILAAIVAVVARAILPFGRGTGTFEDSFDGPPEAAPAFAEMQRLEFQFALAEELGSLDAASLETLRQDVAAARSRYESALAQTEVAVDELTQQERLDIAAAVADCLSPVPAMQPAPALGFAGAIPATAEGKKIR